MALETPTGTITVPNELKNRGIVEVWVQWNYPTFPGNDYINCPRWLFSTDHFSFLRPETSLVHFDRTTPLPDSVLQIGTESALEYDGKQGSPTIQYVGWRTQNGGWFAYTRDGNRV